MPRSFPGNAVDALLGQEPSVPPARLDASFGAFGTILVDGFGERVGLALELRARVLIDRLHRHHPNSAAHSIRVAEITMAMWRTAPDLLGNVETALLGSLLHDVGKLCVPRETLASRHLLTERERVVMSSHAARGAELLLAMGLPESIAAIARGHHERWSGGGYPTALPARSQPPIVRAVAVADAFDAMTDPGRTYRAPLGRREALREVAACAGTHFEPLAANLLADSLADRTEDRSWRDAVPPAFRTAPANHPDLAAVR
jgi:putative nucleotidyltransferase with HDIG domain